MDKKLIFIESDKISKARNGSYEPQNSYAKVPWRNLWWKLCSETLACTIWWSKQRWWLEKLSVCQDKLVKLAAKVLFLAKKGYPTRKCLLVAIGDNNDGGKALACKRRRLFLVVFLVIAGLWPRKLRCSRKTERVWCQAQLEFWVRFYLEERKKRKKCLNYGVISRELYEKGIFFF